MTTESVIEQKYGLGAIDQISFAVRDADDAAQRYTAMFGGPFTVFDAPAMDVLVRDEPSTTLLRLGFGRTADIEVELVQVLSGDYPTLSWLDERGEGLHHVRYRVKDLKATQAEMVADGFTVTLEGNSGPLLFAYLEAPPLSGMTIELLQVPEGIGA